MAQKRKTGAKKSAKRKAVKSRTKPAARTAPKSAKRKAVKPARKKTAKKAIKSAAAKTKTKTVSNTPAKKSGPKKKSKSYELKTKETAVSVDAFLAGVDNPKRVEQARIAVDLLKRVTGEEPRMWGPSIVGYGKYRYVYDSGHSGEMCIAGFSPRKAQFVFYVLGHPPESDEIWSRLGKYKLGGSCLYVNNFEDINLGVLEELVARSVAFMKAKYPD
jgi:hypothetical protein